MAQAISSTPDAIRTSDRTKRRNDVLFGAGSVAVLVVAVSIYLSVDDRSLRKICGVVALLAAIGCWVSIKELFAPSLGKQLAAHGADAAQEVAGILDGSTAAQTAGPFRITEKWLVFMHSSHADAQRIDQLEWVFAVDESMSQGSSATPVRVGLHGPEGSFNARLSEADADQLMKIVLPRCGNARFGFEPKLADSVALNRKKSLQEINESSLPRVAEWLSTRPSAPRTVFSQAANTTGVGALGALAVVAGQPVSVVPPVAALPTVALDQETVVILGKGPLPPVCVKCGVAAEQQVEVELIYKTPAQKLFSALVPIAFMAGAFASSGYVRSFVVLPACKKCPPRRHLERLLRYAQVVAFVLIGFWMFKRLIDMQPILTVAAFPVACAMAIVAMELPKPWVRLATTSGISDEGVRLVDTHENFRAALVQAGASSVSRW
jgi:hypothetical protein